MMTTSFKIALATALHSVLTRGLSILGTDPREMRVNRGGVNWQLNLDEGIDFAIFLLGSFEARTIAAYRGFLKPGSVALDVGANVGAHTLHLASMVGEKGRVLAFEPTLVSFQKLHTNLGLNPDLMRRVTAYQAMLSRSGDDEVPKDIYASWPLAGNSDLHPLHKGALLSTDGAAASTLDSIVAHEGVDRIDLMKMDVDGFEEEVLEGAETVLSRYRPAIVMELAAYAAMERGLDPHRPVDLLLGHGYAFFGLNRRPIDVKNILEATRQTGKSVNVLAVHSNSDKTA